MTVARYDVFDIQDGSHLLRHEFAVGVRDPLRPVDENTQDAAPARAQELNVDDLDAFRAAGALGDFGDFSDGCFLADLRHSFIAIKKWAFAHWCCSTLSLYNRGWVVGGRRWARANVSRFSFLVSRSGGGASARYVQEVVYLAARDDPGGLVAIAILREAWLSSARRERFPTKQRTLAQLDHPSIARLYDADTQPAPTLRNTARR